MADAKVRRRRLGSLLIPMSGVRRFVQIVAFLCTLVVGVAALSLIITQTAWFRDWLRGFIVRQAEQYVNGTVTIGRLEGNLFFGVRLADLDVSMGGSPVIDIGDVDLDYSVLTFLRGDVVLDRIHVDRPVIRLTRAGDRWNLARLLKERPESPEKSRPAFTIAALEISEGTVHLDARDVVSGVVIPSRIEHLNASLGINSTASDLAVDVSDVRFATVDPSLEVASLGAIRRSGKYLSFEGLELAMGESVLTVAGAIENVESPSRSFNVKASSDKLALQQLAALIPALRSYALQPAFDVTVTGPADRLQVVLQASDVRTGKVGGDLTVDAATPGQRVAGIVRLERFNLSPLLPHLRPSASRAARSDITGEARIDLALPSGRLPLSGTYSLRASRALVAGYGARNVVASGRIDGTTVRITGAQADAYGAHATTAGTVVAGERFALDLRGHASGVDLRNLPDSLGAPKVPSMLDVEYTLSGRSSEYSGTALLGTSMLAGSTIEQGTSGTFRFGGGAPQYSARGRVTHLDLQQVGQGFDIAALSQDRYRSRVNATFDVTGAGGGRYPLTLDATGTADDSTLFQATFPRMDATVHLQDGDMRVKSVGEFADLDPAIVSGDSRAAGKLTGSVDVETTLRDYASGVTVDSIDLAGRVTLSNSTVGSLAIDSAVAQGQYANKAGNLEMLEIKGVDVNVTAKGPVSLADTGSTQLTVHAESASLERLGTFVSQPLKGSAVVDATVTGNATKLEARGTLKGSDVKYGDNGALSLASDFVATIPDLTPKQASVQAKSMVTFLEIGGQHITELTADTTYDGSKLDFDATAREGIRQLDAGGTVVFHPDHQEIHLPRLALRSEKLIWRTPDTGQAAVRYSKDRIEIQKLELMNGNQRLTADGVVGSATEPLQVHVENVDVAEIDQLLLGDQRLAGRLNADARVMGALDDPRVEGQFSLTQGAFQNYKFESLTGKIDYVPKGLNVDIRLQATPAEWLTAKGFAPLTLFRPNPEGVGDAHQEPAEGEAIAIDIASSEVGLGLIQGFTSYVTNVTGVMQANLKVTGSGYDPHVEGTVGIRGGSFMVPDLGTSYTGLDTELQLTEKGLTIEQFKILDERGAAMTVGGNLAVHSTSVGAVNVSLKSEKFEIIDNKIASLKLDTDVQITGEIRKPHVEGFVEIESGTIHVTELLQRLTASTYSTEASTVPGLENAPPATPPAAAPDQPNQKEQPPTEEVVNPFDALEMNVALSVPGNLILRGNGVRAANAPVSMGDVNLTVGGVLQLTKAPSQSLRVVGDVHTVRGTYNFQGRRFDIMRDGRVGFSGGDELDPLLDLQARREISGVETFIRVRGTVRRPELSFSSNPPLEEADVLSLIIFNQPINELGEGEAASLADRAGALAAGYLTAGLARSVGQALNLDEFEISTPVGEGASLTIGQQVGRNLFFRLRQAFGSEQTTELILEYQIAEYLRLQATAAEGPLSTQRTQFRRVERGGLDLIFFFSY
ncbi:MAG TPA: translocation/assembly module TamB domain-containing protein [Vicinamibacterales bacterium]|nr:translocation/assembly module TamB domain-containing protein [Vicinamibacterales bacterium]